MIPEEEIDRLIEASGEAVQLAEQGHVQAGYDALELALAYAEALPAEDASPGGASRSLWLPDLITRYQKAMVDYAATYDLCWDEGTPVHREPPGWTLYSVALLTALAPYAPSLLAG